MFLNAPNCCDGYSIQVHFFSSKILSPFQNQKKSLLAPPPFGMSGATTVARKHFILLWHMVHIRGFHGS